MMKMLAEPVDLSGLRYPRIRRSWHNPLLTGRRWPYPCAKIMNPGVFTYHPQGHHGRRCRHTGLLVRVESRTGLSHLVVARSRNGRTGWKVSTTPLLDAREFGSCGRWGVEDARVVWIEECQAWIIVFCAFGPGDPNLPDGDPGKGSGPRVAMAITRDMRIIDDWWFVKGPDNKDAVLLPRRVQGKWVLFHRPTLVSPEGREAKDIWVSYSDDLRNWSDDVRVMACGETGCWDGGKIGLGTDFIETRYGWLALYHGVQPWTNVYRWGAVLLDLDEPHRVLRRTPGWLGQPERAYETRGDYPNVVFPTGWTRRGRTGDRLYIYYGGADRTVALNYASLSEILDHLWALPAPEEMEYLVIA